PGERAGSSVAINHSWMDSRTNSPELFCGRDSDSRRPLLGREQESAPGSDGFRAYDSADSVVDLPADAPRRTHRRGCAELFLRHAAFLRNHSAVGERDEEGNRFLEKNK